MSSASPTRRLLRVLAGLLVVAALVGGMRSGSPFVRVPAAALLGGLVVSGLLYLLWKGFRRFLWRVGRRLAFSYFLIGVLPIPMLALLVGLTGYLLAGYFMTTLHRQAAISLQAELDEAAAAALDAWPQPPSPPPGMAIALYRGGRWVGGDARAPRTWPAWLAEPSGEEGAEAAERYWALGDGAPTMVGTGTRGSSAALALLEPPSGERIGRTSGVWTRVQPSAEPDAGRVVDFRLGRWSLTFGLEKPKGAEEAAERLAFFGLPAGGERGAPFARRPWLWWGVRGGALRSLVTGEEISPAVTVYLNGSPGGVAARLFAGSAELNTRIWAGMIAVTGLLTSIYGLALLMAAYMILGLSRAVNRLSRATAAVRAGDFSVRIPVRRHDQLGELQRSFNAMAGHLESLVATAAQKELLEKELTIARELQRSLLPRSLPASDRVEFATLFEPSAAIGGDYFDILRIDEDRLAVVIADVAGHGLPSGLRMAMIKSALAILVQDGKPAAEILARLDALVRGEGGSRSYVTATLAVVDFRAGSLAITNAGHPPTYLLRDGTVEEILLPGTPLGGLGNAFGHREVALAPGDIVVWLSDGLIETANRGGEPFGYGRVRDALEGRGTAAEVRDRLVAAVALHADRTASADDRTLVAMAYLPSAEASTPSAE